MVNKVIKLKRMSMQRSSLDIEVTELLAKTLENMSKSLAERCIRECALRHNFNAEEEIKELGLEGLSLKRKAMVRGKKLEKSEKKVKKSNEKKFPLPFIGSKVCSTGCQGLSYNHGLFTQCSNKKMENGSYCVSCQSDADKSASGEPTCGTIGGRLAKGAYEFQDNKGRKPTLYIKVLEKMNLSVEAAREAAGMELDSIHFEKVEKVSKKVVSKSTRGRPKKVTENVEAVTDLFAQLKVDDAVIDEEEVEEEKQVVKTKKLSDEEKAAKKAALEEERAAKKADREAKLVLEKEAKKAALEAEKASKKAEKDAEKAAKKVEKGVKKGKKVEKEVKSEEEPKEEKKKMTVTRIMIDGVEYFKSADNVLYNPTTKEAVGLYDPIKKVMKELPEDDDEEEEEEEYESDEN